MTPDQLAIIVTDSEILDTDPAGFASTFYATLFELSPVTRSLFPDDMTAQLTKLSDELAALVDVATAWHRTGAIDGFVERAHDLGRRHRGYGVTHAMYTPVGHALVAALRACLAEFDDAHERAWTTLYHLVADTMREGALGSR